MQVQAIRGFGKQLGGGRIAFGFLFAADITELQVTFHIDAMPAISAADTQAQCIDFMAQVGAQVVAVDRGRRMRAIAHAQRAVAIPGDETEPRIFSDQTVDTGQQAADGAGGTGVVMPAVALAPGAEDFDPGIAAVIGGCRGIEQITLTQAFADGIAQVTAVVDQQGANGRVNLAGQLLESLLSRRRVKRQQQGFEQRIARAQTIRRRRD